MSNVAFQCEDKLCVKVAHLKQILGLLILVWRVRGLSRVPVKFFDASFLSEIVFFDPVLDASRVTNSKVLPHSSP